MLADELSGAQDFASYGCSYQVMDVEVDVDEDFWTMVESLAGA